MCDDSWSSPHCLAQEIHLNSGFLVIAWAIVQILIFLCLPLCQQLVPDKDCLKNEAPLRPEMYQVLASETYLEDAQVAGGCTLLLLIFCFLPEMPTPEHPEQLLSCSPCLFVFSRLSQCARGRKQESLMDSFRICSCLSGGGRWGNPCRAYISSHLPCKTACQSSVQSAWDPRGAQKQKSGHIGGCIIQKLYLLQGRGTPSHIFVQLCCTAAPRHQIIVISVLFSEHVRNLWEMLAIIPVN